MTVLIRAPFSGSYFILDQLLRCNKLNKNKEENTVISRIVNSADTLESFYRL